MPRKKLQRANYHVAWISPLSNLELLPSCLMLDEEHDVPEYDTHFDDNVYICGAMAGHNVVIATCPPGLTGNVNAGHVTGSMFKTFSSIRMAILVGIGGGVPGLQQSEEPTKNVHLGDVVVGWPGDGGPACVQYDAGRWHTDQKFEMLGTISRPDRVLLNALAKLTLDHDRHQSTFQEHRQRLLGSSHNRKFTFPGHDQDRLFQATYRHEGLYGDKCASCDLNFLVSRPARTEEDATALVFHPGRIASGNAVVQDGEHRDKIRERCNGVLCIEMEAAGVDASRPCLVIRGISDYCDSHKGDAWRSYAAGNAAIFARELLSKIPAIQAPALDPRGVLPTAIQSTYASAEPSFECLESLHHAPFDVGNNRHVAGRQSLPATVPAPTQDCLKSLAFLSMENRSHEVGQAVKGTCEWLLQHRTYRNWAASDRGLLWIKGKPGSGKSTLLKYALSNLEAGDSALVLSFFFHGRGDELQKTPLGLFQSLLHQILSQAPDALQDLVDKFETKRTQNGEPGTSWHWHEEDLRSFFGSSLSKVLKTRAIWLFVDALDECGKKNAVKLVETFTSLLQSYPSDYIGLKQFHICFSCRHYPILHLDQSTLEICTEKENKEDISKFVDGQLASFRGRMSSDVPALIKERAAGVFMWARLVVEQVLELDREGYELNKIEPAIHSIPLDLENLYQHLIQKMEPASVKLVQWIYFAIRPLSIDELPWAMVIDADSPHRSIRACQDAQDFVSDRERIIRRVLTLSRGLAEVSQAQVVQFIHQSVKDFFVEKGLLALDGSATSIEAAGRAHFQFSKICIRYLAMEEISQPTHESEDFPFMRYATTSWVAHTQQCDARGISQDNVEDLLELLGWPSNALIELWARVYAKLNPSKDCPATRTRLVHVASRYGMARLLTAMLQKKDAVIRDIDVKDERGRTPLSWAAGNGYEALVRLLLGTGKVDISAKHKYGQTLRSWTAANGPKAIVKRLLSKGKVDIEIDAKDKFGRTPMSWAAQNGHEAVVRLLLGTSKVDIEAKDPYSGLTPLSWAARHGHEAVVRLLLGTGKVDIDAKDTYLGRTPLSWAARNKHEAVVRLLLSTGKVDIDAKDKDGRTPLSWATKEGHEAVVRLLLGTGKVDIEAKDKYGRTPLS